MIFIALFIFFTPAVASEKKIIFDNFSDQLQIIKRDASYYVQGTNIQVELTNRVIIKTINNIKKQDVLGFHHGVSQVTELFQGTQSNFYLLTLHNENRLAQVLFDLQNIQSTHPKKGILLVQPDILQLHSKAEIQVSIKQYSSIKTNSFHTTLYELPFCIIYSLLSYIRISS